MIKFQKLFMGMSDKPDCRLDIISSCLTIAGACINFYLANYVKENDNLIAIVPAGGYQKQDKQSEKALKFLKWYANHYDLEIRTAESEDGEYRVSVPNQKRDFRVDGFITKENAGTEKDLILEFLGCAYHGILFKKL